MDNVLDAIDMIAEAIKNPAQPFSCIRIKLLFLDDLCKELVKQGANNLGKLHLQWFLNHLWIRHQAGSSCRMVKVDWSAGIKGRERYLIQIVILFQPSCS